MTTPYLLKAGRAIRLVRQAVVSGRLVRQGCQECGAARVQAHHPNGYSDAHALDVVWLCVVHHRARHSRRTRPSWATGIRAYTRRTRPSWRDARTHQYTTASSPPALFRNLERIWSLLQTDEERSWALALVQRLAAEHIEVGPTAAAPEIAL